MSMAGLLRTCIAATVIIVSATTAVVAQKLDKVSFGTNWVAQAEHGGFYQAALDGTYARYGLDVTIVPGGPNVNNRILLISRKLDFFMSANTLQSFDAVAGNVPVIAVAAMFQKDPQVFLSHPSANVKKIEDLKPLTLMISRESMTGFYQWMKSEFKFTDAQVKPYNYNAQPFLTDRNSAMQGYASSEPFVVQAQGKMKPNVLLLADNGFNAYSTLIETRHDLIEQKPDLVQRFVDASIIGWYNYIYGDNTAANAEIKRLNPDMSDELLAFSLDVMRKDGIVDSGDSLKDGIGAMNEARIADFFDKMSRAGIIPKSLDYRKSYTLQFINKGVGLNLRPASAAR